LREEDVVADAGADVAGTDQGNAAAVGGHKKTAIDDNGTVVIDGDGVVIGAGGADRAVQAEFAGGVDGDRVGGGDLRGGNLTVDLDEAVGGAAALDKGGARVAGEHVAPDQDVARIGGAGGLEEDRLDHAAGNHAVGSGIKHDGVEVHARALDEVRTGDGDQSGGVDGAGEGVVIKNPDAAGAVEVVVGGQGQ